MEVDIDIQNEDAENGEPPEFFRTNLEVVHLSEDGRLGVVGESYYQAAINMFARGRSFGSSWDDHAPVEALLVPEPRNPYDKNAVRVDLRLSSTASVKVGYLSREKAELYQPDLLKLGIKGKVGACPGRLTGGGPGRYYGVYLHVAPADWLFAPPPVGVLAHFARINPGRIHLKPEWSCTVTESEDCRMALASCIDPRANDEWTKVTCTLEYGTFAKGKYRGQRAIDVHLKGRRVGQLSKFMTDRYSAIVDAVHGRNCIAECTGWIWRKGKSLTLSLSMPRDPARPRREFQP